MTKTLLSQVDRLLQLLSKQEEYWQMEHEVEAELEKIQDSILKVIGEMKGDGKEDGAFFY